MPSSRAILLLLAILPGLLVPAGMGLDRCDCTGALRLVLDGQPPACVTTTQEVVLEGSSCCQRTLAKRTPKPDKEHFGSCEDGSGCPCTTSFVPHAPTKHPASAADQPQPLTHWTPWSSPALLPTHQGYVRASMAGRSPPEPHRQRNRPLLL